MMNSNKLAFRNCSATVRLGLPHLGGEALRGSPFEYSPDDPLPTFLIALTDAGHTPGAFGCATNFVFREFFDFEAHRLDTVPEPFERVSSGMKARDEVYP